MDKKNVLIPIASLEYGSGAPRQAVNLGNRLTSDGYSVTFLPFFESDKEYDVKGDISRVKKKQPRNAFAKLNSFWNETRLVEKIVEENDIDTVVTFMEYQAFVTIISKQVHRFNATVIPTVQNNPLRSKTFYQYGMSYLYPFSDHVVSCSNGLRKILLDELGLESTTIYNSYEPETYSISDNVDLPEPFFLSIGRLTKQKAQWSLIRAFAEYKEKTSSNHNLVILGEGELEEDLKQLSREEGVENAIYFEGVVENVFDYIERCDKYICSSLYEGFSLALLEVISTGTTIISTDCETGPRELLTKADVTEDLEYPFNGHWGYLTETLPRTKILQSHKRKPLHPGEKQLCELMETAERKPHSRLSERVSSFTLNTVIEDWKRIL